jgi:uroporphyrinogen-III synthase
VKAETWLEYTKLLLSGEQGVTLEDKLRSRTVEKVKHYQSSSKEENHKRFERILRGLKYFGFLSEQKVDCQLSRFTIRNSTTSKIW